MFMWGDYVKIFLDGVTTIKGGVQRSFRLEGWGVNWGWCKKYVVTIGSIEAVSLIFTKVCTRTCTN